MRRKWQVEEIVELLANPVELSLERYPEYNRNSLQALRNYYLKKLRRKDMEQDPSQNQEGQLSHERLDKIAELLERSGISLDDIQQVNRVNVYQGYMKNAEGEFETKDLYSVQYVPKRANDLDDFISQADPTKITPTRVKARKDNDYEKVIILPDMQVAFRRFTDELQPTHSPEAIDVALQIIRDYQPDQVILNGDNLDFPTLGKFQQDPTFQGTFKDTINYMHQVLARIRANAPHTKIVYIAGNHETRMEKYIASRAPELHDMVQAGSDKRLHSIPFLLNLDAIGNIEYISGYPAGKYWLSEDLRAIHGQKVGSGSGASVAKMIKDDNNSSTFGHIHRIELAYRTLTQHTREGDMGRFIVAASFGCLARITGEVPSYHSGSDDEGQPVREIENWQNGIGQMEIERSTGRLAVCNAIFIDTFHPEEPYRTRFNGKDYTPND